MEGRAGKKDGEFLNTLARGLSVLRAFSKEHPEMTLSEVAVETALSPAVARRCLNTLQQLGYVNKQDNRFMLSPEVMVFASAFLESMNLEQVIRPHLQSVRDATGDSSSMAVLSGSYILYLLHVSTNRMVRLAAGVGTRFPAHATSLGRILLAHLPGPELKSYLDTTQFRKLTEKTEVRPAKLEAAIRKAGDEGYATVQDELDYGIVSVAVPVLGDDQQVVASINCSTATSRVGLEEMVETRLPHLHRAAREIEIELQRYPALVHSIRSAGEQNAR